jgi:hypothetical protein
LKAPNRFINHFRHFNGTIKLSRFRHRDSDYRWAVLRASWKA